MRNAVPGSMPAARATSESVISVRSAVKASSTRRPLDSELTRLRGSSAGLSASSLRPRGAGLSRGGAALERPFSLVDVVRGTLNATLPALLQAVFGLRKYFYESE